MTGLRREIFEETGLKVDAERLTGVYQNMNRHIIALVFRCRPAAGDLATNAEASALRWATADEVGSLLDEAYAVRILDALDDTSPSIRWHDGVTFSNNTVPANLMQTRKRWLATPFARGRSGLP